MAEIMGTAKAQDALKSFQYASSQINQNQTFLGHPQPTSGVKVDSEEGDAFDRLIKKTYDRDCEKFFQRIDKLKRMNSCGGSS